MSLISFFDPWKSRLCTCPKKYSFNPYTGCEHRCFYCYITSYIPKAHERCMPKKDLLKKLRREIKNIDKRFVISMSNSSDPYTKLENELMLTRACLNVFRKENARVLIITKSDMVARDRDIISGMQASVSMTVTTLNQELAEKIEPHAPEPEKRLRAIEKLVESGVKVSCRVDPIIPFVNDSEPEIRTLIKELADIGVEHITSSTFKPRFDSWKRFSLLFPEEANMLKKLYERHGNAFYLQKEIRFRKMKFIKELCDKHGLSFAACREGFKELKTAKTCDGQHLVGK